jgi:glycosyltransferase involved in cell wall biosynthesis
MLVSVAICTWNRARLLDQTLQTVAGLRIPPGVEWEVVVVNNNSPDDTERVLDAHESRLPLRRFFEPTQGSSHARNRVVEEARGDFIVWFDDDVLVDPECIAAYLDAASRYPDATYFGGTIEPWFEVEPPASIRRHFARLAGAYAVRDFGPDVRPLKANEHPFSANLGVRGEVQRRFRFDTRLGRVAGGLVGDDESKMLAEMAAAGHRGVWVGTAAVKHHMPPDRLTWDYIWRWSEGIGRGSARRQGVRACSTLFGRPRWMLREYAARRLRGLFRWALGSPGWVDHYLRAAHFAGMMAECRDARRNPQQPPRPGFLVPPIDADANTPRCDARTIEAHGV